MTVNELPYPFPLNSEYVSKGCEINIQIKAYIWEGLLSSLSYSPLVTQNVWSGLNVEIDIILFQSAFATLDIEKRPDNIYSSKFVKIYLKFLHLRLKFSCLYSLLNAYFESHLWNKPCYSVLILRLIHAFMLV